MSKEFVSLCVTFQSHLSQIKLVVASYLRVLFILSKSALSTKKDLQYFDQCIWNVWGYSMCDIQEVGGNTNDHTLHVR